MGWSSLSGILNLAILMLERCERNSLPHIEAQIKKRYFGFPYINTRIVSAEIPSIIQSVSNSVQNADLINFFLHARWDKKREMR